MNKDALKLNTPAPVEIPEDVLPIEPIESAAPATINQAEEERGFHKRNQGDLTLALSKIIPKKQGRIDPLAQKCIVNKGKVKIELPENIASKYGVTTQMLRDYLAQRVEDAASKDEEKRTYIISPAEWLEVRGLKASVRKEAKTDLINNVNALLATTCYYTYTTASGEVKRVGGFNILEKADPMKGGRFKCIFTRSYGQYALNRGKAYYPDAAYQFNPKYNPNSYSLIQGISAYKKMNIGKDNEDIISVKVLLDEHCPFIPKYADVFKSGRHYQREIIEPFERDMNALETCGISYCYHDPETGEEFKESNLGYEKWITLNVHITWSRYPYEEETRKRRREEAAQRERERQEGEHLDRIEEAKEKRKKKREEAAGEGGSSDG